MFKNNLRSRFKNEIGVKVHENIPKYADWLEQQLEEKFKSTNIGSPKLFLQVQDIIECEECSDADKVAGIKVLMTEQTTKLFTSAQVVDALEGCRDLDCALKLFRGWE